MMAERDSEIIQILSQAGFPGLRAWVEVGAGLLPVPECSGTATDLELISDLKSILGTSMRGAFAYRPSICCW